MVDVEVRVDTPHLDNLADFDPKPVLARMEVYLTREIGRAFETEGASRDTPWKALSPAYAAWKARNGKSPKILHLTGGLRAGWGARARGEDYLVFGALPGSTDGKTDTRDKARWHHYGLGTNPKRTILAPIPRDYEMLRSIIEEELSWGADL